MFSNFEVVRSQIQWNLKVETEISVCTAVMLNIIPIPLESTTNPYIESTTIISDTTNNMHVL